MALVAVALGILGASSLAGAEQNGANADCPSGPYCATTSTTTPSANGNGNGQATGRPCAGCVGSADDKNPPGQLPGPEDANAGYECDKNSGIGQGNPAHTGCNQTTTTTPTTTTPTTTTPPTTTPVTTTPVTPPPPPPPPPPP
ncbi:MAG: hypothetical protein M3296_04670, partial [Actinomycetota bacterium]|nr:hypothetical protein [Actinomycetota bacterium]